MKFFLKKWRNILTNGLFFLNKWRNKWILKTDNPLIVTKLKPDLREQLISPQKMIKSITNREKKKNKY